jgi:glucose-1-phosphate adenylyltransferase
VTVSAVRARKEEAAGTLGVLEIDRDYRLTGFEEKPAEPKTMPEAAEYALASMGVYIFKTTTLLEALEEEGDDFGHHIIPKMVDEHRDIAVYDFERENRIGDYEMIVTDGVRNKVHVDRTRDSSYWRDVGTIDSYYEASIDLVGVNPTFGLYGELAGQNLFKATTSEQVCPWCKGRRLHRV